MNTITLVIDGEQHDVTLSDAELPLNYYIHTRCRAPWRVTDANGNAVDDSRSPAHLAADHGTRYSVS